MGHYMAELVLRGRPVLMIGGGRVAQRKLAGVLPTGALVTVAAPRLDPWLEGRFQVGKIAWRAEPYTPALLEREPRPLLVFAVTGDAQLNRAIAADCARRAILCNSADDPAASGFLVPAVVQRGPVSVAVSTAGHSPALSRLLKERIDRWLEPAWEGLALAFGQLRNEVKERLPEPARRYAFWRASALAVEEEKRLTVAGGHEAWLRQRLAAAEAAPPSAPPGQAAENDPEA